MTVGKNVEAFQQWEFDGTRCSFERIEFARTKLSQKLKTILKFGPRTSDYEYDLVTIPEGFHPFSSRTRKLRPPGPMILGFTPGKVGRCQVKAKR